jgi:CRISPR-associated protein Cst2
MSGIGLTNVEKNAKFSFVEITFLINVERSILNAAGSGGGNLTELKKTTEIDGTQRVFVSGTSLKWSIKEFWKDANRSLRNHDPDLNVSPIIEKTEGAQISSACNEEKYIDDDLFGYFSTGKKLSRTAPVKTNGMISLFDSGLDIDNLVRYSEKSQNHSLFDKEISTNVFRSSWAIELDRIGISSEFRGTSQETKINLSSNIKEKRVKFLFDAIFNLWQRTQQSNYFTNTQPQLMTIMFRKDKSPIIGNKLKIDEHYMLDIDALEEIINYHSERISLGYIASHKSFIKNFDELKKRLHNQLDNRIIVSDLNELKNKILSSEFNFIRV